jgi:hypothetical protein
MELDCAQPLKLTVAMIEKAISKRATVVFRLFMFDLCSETLLSGWEWNRQASSARPLIMDRSTAGRIAPAGAFILSVFHNARHCRISTREGQHLLSPRAICLRVVVDERNTDRVVMISGLLTVGTARLRVDN